MARRKIGNSHTTICIKWDDKETFRKFAKFVKKTKTGDLYESDSALFTRILKHYSEAELPQGDAHSTYPSRTTSQEHDQQG